MYKVDNSVFSVGWVTCLQFDENKIVAGTADRVVKIVDMISGSKFSYITCRENN